jgi:5-methylcytosine-specific restriction endonuclease McrA
MAKKKKKVNRHTFAKGALRRASLMWPEISECRRLARRGPNSYECAMCHGLFKSKECDVDHRQPVVDIIEGYQGLEVFAERLFCDVENLDLLCKNCHDSKSQMEVSMRKYARAKRKEQQGEVEDEEI